MVIYCEDHIQSATYCGGENVHV